MKEGDRQTDIFRHRTLLPGYLETIGRMNGEGVHAKCIAFTEKGNNGRMRNVLHRSLSFVVIVALVFSLMAVFATETAHAAELRKTTIVLTKKGETYQQKLILPSGKAVKSSKVEWESENNKIAKISSTGKITAVSKGTVKMTGKYNRTTFSFRVVVNDAYFKYQQFYVRGIGARKTLTLYTAANKKIPASKIKWSSTDSDVAKVSSKGVVTGVSSGNATIKAKYKGRTYSCIVYVWNGVSISVTSNTVSVSEDGTEISLKAGDETEVPLSILKNCGNTVRFNIIEGEGVVSLKLTDMSYPEGSDWYDETLEIKALKAGTATIKVYTADTEGPSDIEKNCAYLRVTVRENTPSSGGTVTPGGNQGGATPGGSQLGNANANISCRNQLPYVCILNNATFRIESVSFDSRNLRDAYMVTVEGTCVSILSNHSEWSVSVPYRVYDANGTITDSGLVLMGSLRAGDRARETTIAVTSGPGPYTIEFYGNVQL